MTDKMTTKEDPVVAIFGLGIRVTASGAVQIWPTETVAVPPEVAAPVPTPAPPPGPKEFVGAMRKRKTPRKSPIVKENPMYVRGGRRLNIDGVEYISMQEAARQLGVRPYTIKDRCASSSWPTWTIID